MGHRDRIISWDHLHGVWTNVCEGLDSNLLNEPYFLPIESSPIPSYLARTSLDWWPKNRIAERRNPRSKPGYITLWETKVGTLRTVEMLWDARGNPEKQHAIYILASLWDKKKDLPKQWRGSVYGLMNEIEQVIRNRFPEIGIWHHASREAMPIDLLRHVHGESMLVPDNEHDLLYITAVEAVLAEANWQLIEYVPELPNSIRLVNSVSSS